MSREFAASKTIGMSTLMLTSPIFSVGCDRDKNGDSESEAVGGEKKGHLHAGAIYP